MKTSIKDTQIKKEIDFCLAKLAEIKDMNKLSPAHFDIAETAYISKVGLSARAIFLAFTLPPIDTVWAGYIKDGNNFNLFYQKIISNYNAGHFPSVAIKEPDAFLTYQDADSIRKNSSGSIYQQKAFYYLKNMEDRLEFTARQNEGIPHVFYSESFNLN